mmetsp:Transcript_21977/g.47112  ORF Transcript_21977/g.47112 Transcript_21977/m.47112 type:complete len:266 (-) Transcript_21977:927-1724(-)
MVVEEGSESATAVEEEPTRGQDRAEMAARALDNAGLRREPAAPDDDDVPPQEAQGPPPALDVQDGAHNDDGAEGDADGGLVEPPPALPPGVPVVEDDADSVREEEDAYDGMAENEGAVQPVEEGAIEPARAGVLVEDHDEEDAQNAGVIVGDEIAEPRPEPLPPRRVLAPSAAQEEQLGESRRYPRRSRRQAYRPLDEQYQFFGRSINSPDDHDLPGLDIRGQEEGIIVAHLFSQFSLKEGPPRKGHGPLDGSVFEGETRREHQN